MQTPQIETSSTKLSDYGHYLVTRLEVHEQSRDLAPLPRTRMQQVQQSGQQVGEARRRVIGTRAHRDAAEEQVDDVILAFADDVYNEAGRSRDAPYYQRRLPKGTPPLVQPRGRDQVRVLRDYCTFLEALPPDPILERHLPRLRAKCDQLEQRIVEYEAAVQAFSQAQAQELLAKQDFIDTYVSTYGELVKLFGSKSRADRFFPRLSSGRRGGGSPGPEGTDGDE